MLTNWFLFIIRARKMVFLAAVVWAIAGIWIAVTSPIDALPDLSENQVLVYTPWPNHNPPEIHEDVTRPIAESLVGIPGLASVRGSSDVGFSLLYLIFDPSVSYTDAMQRVADKLASAKLTLPSGVAPQIAPEGLPIGQIVWYTLTGRDTDLMELRSWQDNFIVPRLRSLAGVAEIASVGGFLPEVHVALDPQALAGAGLSIADIDEQLSNLPPSLLPPLPLDPIQFDSGSLTTQLASQLTNIEKHPLTTTSERTVRLQDISRVTLQPAPRFGVFERDGNELVGGVVHMKAGENPLQVTQAVLAELQRIGDDLPTRFRLHPCYDRIGLISGAVSTVSRTLVEALIVTTLCVVLIMRHFRTSLVITLTLPLAVLGAFIGMQVLRTLGMNMHLNIMSLAGIAISIGVLVDASIVMVENVTHRLKREFGDRRVEGETDWLIARASAMVARPSILAVLIMIVSFLPVFALGGIDGQLIRPLAWTKTLTLLSVVLLTLTLVPALSRALIRGKLRSEQDSKILQSVVRVYKPVLAIICDGSIVFAFMLCSIFVLAAAATGNAIALRSITALSVATLCFIARGWSSRLATVAGLILIALSAQSWVRPIGLALRLPLDEGMVMDMPITLPRMTVQQAADDLKARNMILCRFPEVQMVTGKAGRAETAFDPAPIDMIETMVEFRSSNRWPKRRLMAADARRYATEVIRKMAQANLIEAPPAEVQLVDSIVESGLKRFDAVQRELCWNLLKSFEQSLGNELTEALASEVIELDRHRTQSKAQLSRVQIQAYVNAVDRSDRLRLAQQLDASSLHVVVCVLRRLLVDHDALDDATIVAIAPPTQREENLMLRRLQSMADRRWKEFVRAENQMLYRRAGATWIQIAVDELCTRVAIVDPSFERTRQQAVTARYAVTKRIVEHHGGGHGGLPSTSELPLIEPHAAYEKIVRDLRKRFDASVWLWPHAPNTLASPRGELDTAVQMPGWANVWTRPIQNRIDMLTTGVNAEVGIRVLGDDFASVVATSEKIAQEIQKISGAADVIADPIRDKDYVEFDLKSDSLHERGIDFNQVQRAIEISTTGRLIAVNNTGNSATPLRLKMQSSSGPASDPAMGIVLPLRSQSINEQRQATSVQLIALGDIAQIRHHDGPATIKSYDGRLCNYVRLNVRGRDASQWVEEAKVALSKMSLPEDIEIQWTGQFEHAARTRSGLLWMVPTCFIIIVLLLFLAFRDVADALLMFLSIPGALAGAILTQWLLGFPFSMSVAVGYIACFGMAAATSMVMIVYLRQAVDDAGGLKAIDTVDQLKSIIISGAVHRLRPKLLTEATMIFSLAPLLWSFGVGADVIRPMAAPVLGGILVADEVVDLLIPALFFAIRRRRWLKQHPIESE